MTPEISKYVRNNKRTLIPNCMSCFFFQKLAVGCYYNYEV